MTSRTIEETVTFAGPFRLNGLDEDLPAGDYRVEFDEDLVQGVSFPVYRRVRVIVHLPANRKTPRRSRCVAIDAAAFEAAQAASKINGTKNDPELSQFEPQL
tara:strand:- start:419 stop:724 length:306 start_codon:yes stop_codon:yes gene_type:complete